MEARSAEDAAFIMSQAERSSSFPVTAWRWRRRSILREMADLLKAEGVTVKYAIHPVAGRMPGHMNVLLAEADVPMTSFGVFEEHQPEFPETDVAYRARRE